MQNDRLFQIVYLLMEQKTMTAKELAKHFEVSTRTILRDVDTLALAGVPVYTTKGKNGGISIMDGFVLDKTTISDEEQDQILAALQGLSVSENYEAEGLLKRLSAFFQKTDTNWIEVDYSRWGNSSADREKFNALKEAILGKRAITFEYPNPFRKTAPRKVYPLKLVYKSHAWYLQGYCLLRNNYRTFKINRIMNLEVLEETFRNLKFTPPAIEVEADEQWDMVDLKLKFDPQATYRLYDEFDASTVVKQKDGSFLVDVSLPFTHWIYEYLLSFGDQLEVLAPEEVRKGLAERLGKMSQYYYS